MASAEDARAAATADPETAAWLRDLRGAGPAREAAVRRLGELLVRAARWEIRRRAGAQLPAEELEELAAQSGHDALMAVLAKLESFRGESRFTTWAYKFALLEAAVAMRRRSWRGREVPLRPQEWSLLSEGGPAPDEEVETAELLSALAAAIDSELTAHQREVLIALAIDGVPLDVLAERLGSTRNALYKTLHDARRKLRRRLTDDGLIGAPERSEAGR